jgi:hypothetical protein
VVDKRLLIVDGGFGGDLRNMQRASTLGWVLRVVWDGADVLPLTKHNRVGVTQPHVCILAHITQDELTRLLGLTEIYSGLAGRFLWCAARRSRLVALPRPMLEHSVSLATRSWWPSSVASSRPLAASPQLRGLIARGVLHLPGRR